MGTRRGPARQAYRQFVSQGRGQRSPWSDLRQQIYLGDDRFVEKMQARLDDEARLDEIPAKRRAPPKPLAHYVAVYRERDAAIAAAYLDGGYTMKAIGDEFGLHYSMVSRIVKAVASARSRTDDG